MSSACVSPPASPSAAAGPEVLRSSASLNCGSSPSPASPASAASAASAAGAAGGAPPEPAGGPNRMVPPPPAPAAAAVGKG